VFILKSKGTYWARTVHVTRESSARVTKCLTSFDDISRTASWGLYLHSHQLINRGCWHRLSM